MSRRLPQWMTCCGAVFLAASAVAGTVERATIVADPQMQVKDGALHGCGYRFRLVPESLSGLTTVVALDASFNLYTNGMGLLKGGALSVKTAAPAKPTIKPIESFWFMVKGQKPIAPIGGKLVAAETKGYLLQGASVDSVMELFTAVWDETQISIGMRLRGERIDRIYAGTAQVSEPDKAQGAECIDQLIKQMERDLDATDSAPAR